MGNEYDELESLRLYASEECYKKLRQDKVTRYKSRSELRDQIKSVPCADCHQKYPPYVMDFDHVRGKKVAPVSTMLLRSEKAFLSEIEKCDIICSNCHRERTHQRSIDKTKFI